MFDPGVINVGCVCDEEVMKKLFLLDHILWMNDEIDLKLEELHSEFIGGEHLFCRIAAVWTIW